MSLLGKTTPLQSKIKAVYCGVTLSKYVYITKYKISLEA